MMRAIRTAVLGALGAVMAAAALPSLAAQPAERELMGIRLWRDHSTVLSRHGSATRQVPGLALPPVASAAAGPSFQLGMTGGAPGAAVPGGTGMPALGGMPGAPMAGGMTAPGGPMMGGMVGPGGPMMGGMMGPGGPTMGGMASPGGRGGGIGLPGGRGGMTAPMGGMGGLRMGGGRGRKDGDEGSTDEPASMGGVGSMMTNPMAGMAGRLSAMMGGSAPSTTVGGTAGNVPQSVSDEDVRETWIYERGPLTYHFCFNHDGRVIKIRVFGTKGGTLTSRGIGLGAAVSSVYKAYGWAGTTQKAAENAVTLDYSQKAHVVFDLENRGKGLKVVGITIAPSEISGSR